MSPARHSLDSLDCIDSVSLHAHFLDPEAHSSSALNSPSVLRHRRGNPFSSQEHLIPPPAASLLESVQEPSNQTFSFASYVQSRIGNSKKGLSFSQIKRIVPILEWLPAYKWRECLKGDLLAGLTIAVMTIPQGMVSCSYLI